MVAYWVGVGIGWLGRPFLKTGLGGGNGANGWRFECLGGAEVSPLAAFYFVFQTSLAPTAVTFRFSTFDVTFYQLLATI